MYHLQLLVYEQSIFHNFDGNNYAHIKLDYSLHSHKHGSRFPETKSGAGQKSTKYGRIRSWGLFFFFFF